MKIIPEMSIFIKSLKDKFMNHYIKNSDRKHQKKIKIINILFKTLLFTTQKKSSTKKMSFAFLKMLEICISYCVSVL